jgi:hypothetical protein
MMHPASLPRNCGKKGIYPGAKPDVEKATTGKPETAKSSVDKSSLDAQRWTWCCFFHLFSALLWNFCAFFCSIFFSFFAYSAASSAYLWSPHAASYGQNQCWRGQRPAREPLG